MRIQRCLPSVLIVAFLLTCPATGAPSGPVDGSTLPFPPKPSGSTAKRTMQESIYSPLPNPRRLPVDAPNILIILIDDAGPALPDTYGGDIHTPTLSRIANSGVSFNRFHTTAMCSPTRAALLTGRNHHRVGAGQIASLANDWDGYSGMWPATSASLAKVLGCYGYATSAFGKWHNTPHSETSQAGPFNRWPTGNLVGFDYFYGFLAGETSQWEPAIVENFNRIEPVHGEGYHLTEDLADKGIEWMRRQRALAPDRPFLMYWAPGAVHAPHHVAREWADKYKGRFDDGWEAMRERVFARQKALGYIPADTQLTPRHASMAAWDDIPEEERGFQRRLMEVFAGFCEHTDTQVGRLIDELDRQGIRDNTLVFYIWGDNGSSAEGQNGSISEFLAQSGTATTVQDQLRALEELGGLDALGGKKTDNHYHGGWAWAGSTPYQGTKLIASHFGGTRNPLAVSWPKSIKPAKTPRSQFHHVNDIAPTIYDILNITPPQTVDGVTQDPMDGISMTYALESADEPGRKQRQYFEIMGSRAIYQGGFIASAFGPRIPWKPGLDPAIYKWTPDKDQWELYDLSKDFSQANDLAENQPEKLREMTLRVRLRCQGESRLPHRRRPVGRAAPRVHAAESGDRVHLHGRRGWRARSLGAQARAAEQLGDGFDRTEARLKRRALRLGWVLGRSCSLGGRRRHPLRVQPLPSRTDPREHDRQVAHRPGEDRDRVPG